MTRARNGAASVAPARAREPHWHIIPDDDDRGPSRTFPPCADGDELLARLPGGEVVTVTVDRRRGVAFRTEDGESVEPDAIATPPRPSRAGATQPEAARLAAGMVQLKVRITAEQRRRLQWIHDEDGHDLSTIVGCHIDQEYEERQR